MPDQEQIAQQQELLMTFRRRLAYHIEQRAALGVSAPFSLAEDIRKARAEIQRLKDVLREWDAPIEDLPDDGEPPDARDMFVPKVDAGLEALVELMRATEARAAVAVYRASFESVCGQIAILGGYKTLHDLLQQLEDRHAVIARCCKGLPHDPSAWDDVERDEPEVYDKTAELLEFAGRAPFAAETASWTPKLGRAQRDLRAALEGYDAERLKDALGRIKEVIDRQLSRANTRLASVADALRLATLVDALRHIRDRLAPIDLESASQRLDDFRQGVEALAGLDEQLRQAVALHTAFQDFDDELRRVEGAIEHDPGELADAWQDIGPLMRALCANNVAAWAAKLNALGDDLERALAAADPLRLRRAFSRYRSHATVCFNRIDHDLRDLCAALQQAGTPLDRVLKVLQ